MKNVLLIVKKEFNRFFKDKRMILMIFLPGILIFGLYSILGTVMGNIAPAVEEGYKPTAYVSNLPQSLNGAFDTVLEIKEYSGENEAKSDITGETLDVAVIFPADFEAKIEAGERPDVKVYYNSANITSYTGYSCVISILSSVNAFTVNAPAQNAVFDLVNTDEQAVSFISMIIPMLMFSLLASSCISVAPESIAGEKERGTMATMLITPVRRIDIVLGKIISLSCYAMLSGVTSFLGVILSLPKLSGGMLNLGAVSYGAGTYFMLFGIIISVVLVLISAFSVLSTLAKNVKEASAFISPFMILIIVMGMASMFFTNPSVGLYAIPFLGSGIAMSAVLSMTASVAGVVLAIVSNLALSALLIVLMGFLFKKESVMLKK